jgi:hypothetical protein
MRRSGHEREPIEPGQGVAGVGEVEGSTVFEQVQAGDRALQNIRVVDAPGELRAGSTDHGIERLQFDGNAALGVQRQLTVGSRSTR